MRSTPAPKRLETWLERLIDDKSLRSDFFATPSATCHESGMTLSWSEMGALLALPEAYFDEFAKGLPSRVAKPLWAEGDWTSRSH